MGCILCNKQYVGKAETSFNIRLTNHQKDVEKSKQLMASKHFQHTHNSNKNKKFTITDLLMNTFKSKETLS